MRIFLFSALFSTYIAHEIAHEKFGLSLDYLAYMVYYTYDTFFLLPSVGILSRRRRFILFRIWSMQITELRQIGSSVILAFQVQLFLSTFHYKKLRFSFDRTIFCQADLIYVVTPHLGDIIAGAAFSI